MNIIATGARNEVINRLNSADILKTEDVTESYYNKIRSSDNTDLIKRVSENLNKPFSDVEEVINHVFKEKHLFSNGEIQRFGTDAEIVKALERLKTGEHTNQDILWFNHEFLELTYMKNNKYNVYEVAHKMANKKFNWEATLK